MKNPLQPLPLLKEQPSKEHVAPYWLRTRDIMKALDKEQL